MTGRAFIVGDIHGCYDQLVAAMRRVGFDRSSDRLYAVGDLIDRGPRSLDVLQLLREPWFFSVKGNHEVMLEANYLGHDDSGMHASFGGEWFDALPADQREACFELVRDLPVTMTVTTPSGRRIGIVHADLCGSNWDAFVDMIGTHQLTEDVAMWSRSRIRNLQGYPNDIAGVDLVIMGHTINSEPVQAGNCRWIDTGCYRTGVLTLEELV